MEMSLQAEGLDATARTLRGMQARGSALQPVLRDIADDFLDVEREQFRSEGARASVWQQLAPSTVRQRGSAHPILGDHGALRASLTRQNAPGSVRQVSATDLLMGTDDPKAQFHQGGTRRMPARQVIDLLPADRERWAEKLARYLAP